MLIVGGSYREATSFPEKNDFFGSGLKAAAAISGIVNEPKLISAVCNLESIEASAIANTYGIKANFIERNHPITFHYFTPITSPKIYCFDRSTLRIKESTKETALVFGMLEAESAIEADYLVIDPQRPEGTCLDLSNYKYKKLAIVLNQHEAKRLSGAQEPRAAGPLLQKQYGADVVVVKCGALGALVVTSDGRSQWVGAHPSPVVWPIGSGDIFSAFFSVYWGDKKKSPFESAQVASAAVATWTKAPDLLPLPQDFHTNHSLSPSLSEAKPKIYLAGPFFSLSQCWMIETARDALKNLGADVFSPKHEVGLGGDEVALPDIEGLEKCDSVFAILDGLDSGTIFEIGYAFKKGIPVIGFTWQDKDPALKMVRGSGITIYKDFSSAIYNSIWAGM